MTAQTILPANSVTGGFEVDHSVRFDRASDSLLYADNFANHTSTKKFTISFWVKRSILGSNQAIISQRHNNSYSAAVKFKTDNTLEVFDVRNDEDALQVVTNRTFTDTSAWYHIVVSSDVSPSSPALKIFVNGVQETSFATSNQYSQNETTSWNNGYRMEIGSVNGDYFDGYIAQPALIDAYDYDADSFGEFDEDTGIWKPIRISGLTTGTNGRFLDFVDSSDLGKNANGINQNFTLTNLGAVDQTTDTCTNNFCTWNVAADNQDVTFAEGACKVIHGTATARRPVISTFGVANGKWYWEWKAAGSPTAANMEVGIVNYASPTSQGRYLGQALTSDADFTTYIGDGNINVSGSASDSGTAYAGGNIIGVAVDVDNERIYFYKNSTLINSGGTDYSGMTIGSGFIFMSNADRSGSASYTASVNFGQPVVANSSDAADGNGHGRFEYAPPSGFLALCTKNLAETG